MQILRLFIHFVWGLRRIPPAEQGYWDIWVVLSTHMTTTCLLDGLSVITAQWGPARGRTHQNGVKEDNQTLAAQLLLCLELICRTQKTNMAGVHLKHAKRAA